MSVLNSKLGWATLVVAVLATVAIIYSLNRFVDQQAANRPGSDDGDVQRPTKQPGNPTDRDAITAPKPAPTLPPTAGDKPTAPSITIVPSLTPNLADVPSADDTPSSASPAPAPPSAVPAIRKIDIPPVRLTSQQRETIDAKFVGMDACAKCHEDTLASCMKTTHGRAFRDVDLAAEPPDGEFSDERTGKRFRVYRKDNEFRHKETLVGADGKEIELADHAMRYVVGSGHLTSTYLVERDGFLTESPITWYTSRKAWDYSPGYEKENVGFARPITMECLQCHTGQTASLDGSRNRLKVQSMTIDCERCHGPGSKHVEAHDVSEIKAPPSGQMDNTITNPKWLTRQLNEDACALCHLQGESEAYLLGRSTQNFLPGHHLSDYRIDYSAKQADDSMKIVGHVEQLHQSKCYQKSPSMTCVTCHDPHRDPSTFDSVQVYRDKCIACHQQEDSCRMPKAERLQKSPRDACSSCHMPSSPTDIPHVAAHQHRIGLYGADKKPDSSTSAVVPDTAVTLVPIQDVSHLPLEEQQRCLAMAYLALSKKTPKPELSQQYLQRANSLLATLVQSGVQDPESLAGLAHTYLRRDPNSAIRLAKHAFETGQTIEPDTEVKLQFALSDSFLALRQIPNAVEPLQRLTKLRLQATDWYLLAVCQYNAGDLPEALKSVRRAIEIRPEVPNHHALAAELLTQQQQTDEANRHRELVKLLGGRKTQ